MVPVLLMIPPLYNDSRFIKDKQSGHVSSSDTGLLFTLLRFTKIGDNILHLVITTCNKYANKNLFPKSDPHDSFSLRVSFCFTDYNWSTKTGGPTCLLFLMSIQTLRYRWWIIMLQQYYSSVVLEIPHVFIKSSTTNIDYYDTLVRNISYRIICYSQISWIAQDQTVYKSE